MPATFDDCALIKFLSRDPDYRTRVARIRDELGKWLQHTAAIFPHYPDHTKTHSEQIITQLSKLLFRNNRPILKNLSRAEAYTLVCAAFLHDSGMVVTNAQIEEILKSSTWAQFTSAEGKGSQQWNAIQEFRKNQKHTDLTDYVVGTQLRLLVADFIRRQHHKRAPLALELHPSIRELVDFSDRRYFEAISLIAVGHGLDRSEISDTRRYKEVADLGGEEVNVQFMTRLLRIGDLLDMRSSRADHYACSAASPLPADSVPHWKQYSTIIHERVSPERIEYTCECQDQDTHATLRDWFGWLCDEIRETGIAMQHAERHKEWTPPKCTVNNEWPSSPINHAPTPTITIKPASNATYTFHRWKLELDHEQILERLIYDIYDQPEAFIRELLQNSLDATRCRLYEDFTARHPNLRPPEDPTKFPNNILAEYPITISLTQEQPSTPDNKDDVKQAIQIEDNGIGMDSSIARKYLLQIGKSYYQSEEFRTNYKFAPTSRFGVGFLSVFAVSNLVTVESAKLPLPAHEQHGLRLTLRGPKNYLLTERWTPFEERPTSKKHGTRIKIILNKPLPPGRLTELAKIWCRQTEVPIIINDLETSTKITPQPTGDRTVKTPSATNPGAHFEIRSFQFDHNNIKGELLKLAYIDSNGESWLEEWHQEKDLAGKPVELPPALPESYVSLHGIFQSSPYTRSTKWSYAVDDRRHSAWTNMARSGINSERIRLRASMHIASEQSPIDEVIQKEISRALTHHLRTEPRAQRSDNWRYAARLLADPLVDPELAWSWPATTRNHHRDKIHLISARDAASRPDLTIAFQQSDFFARALPFQIPSEYSATPFICHWEAPSVLRKWISERIAAGAISKAICAKEAGPKDEPRRRWIFITISSTPVRAHPGKTILVPIEGTNLRIATVADTTLANTLLPLGSWLLKVYTAAHSPRPTLSPSISEAVFRTMSNPFNDELARLISKWRISYPPGDTNSLPPELTDEEVRELAVHHGRFY